MTVAGFGFRRGATLDSLRDALAQAMEMVHATAAETSALPMTSIPRITLLATAQDKAEAPCMRALASELGLPVCAVTPAQAGAVKTLTESAAVRDLRGTGSTAEAAALAAALLHRVPHAALLHARVVSADRLATCAIAAQPPQPRQHPRPS